MKIFFSAQKFHAGKFKIRKRNLRKFSILGNDMSLKIEEILSEPLKQNAQQNVQN